MEVDEARDFVREHSRAVMLTYRRDGSPQLSPVLVALDDRGRCMVSTRETAMKRRNLARDARTSLCVLSEGFFGPWVRIDGRADVVGLPEAMDLLVDYYRRLRGEHDDWDEYRQAIREEQRVMVLIHIEEVGPDVRG